MRARRGIDKSHLPAYSPFPAWGGRPVNRLRWTIAVLGMCLICISSMALRVDDPKTPYVESETPFNLIAPAGNNSVVRPHFTARVSRPITMFQAQRLGRYDDALMYAISAMRAICPLQARPNLLCTLLC